MKVSIIMGSVSDWEIAEKAAKILKTFKVPFDMRVLSAHRTPDALVEYLRQDSASVYIALAGAAAHLAGVIAAHTVAPVIAVPVQTGSLGGLDSLLAMVQMPSGVPVATVAINGAANAGLLAVQMLAVNNEGLRNALKAHRDEQAATVLEKDTIMQQRVRTL